MEQGIALFKSSGNNPDVGNYLGNVMAKLEESAGPIPSKEDGKVRGGIYKYPGEPPVPGQCATPRAVSSGCKPCDWVVDVARTVARVVYALRSLNRRW